MKLYTEEQVKSAFKIGLRENYIDEQDAENFANKGIKYLTPIELPSDEDIVAKSKQEPDNSDIETAARIGYVAGAKWMRNKIQGGNK